MIYPDSRDFRFMAESLAAGERPYQGLGTTEAPFIPQSYAAMKAFYPFVVSLVMRLVPDAVSASVLVARVAAVLAVPVAFVAVTRAVRSRQAGVAAAALVAASFVLGLWSGFIAGDTSLGTSRVRRSGPGRQGAPRRME